MLNCAREKNAFARISVQLYICSEIFPYKYSINIYDGDHTCKRAYAFRQCVFQHALSIYTVKSRRQRFPLHILYINVINEARAEHHRTITDTKKKKQKCVRILRRNFYKLKKKNFALDCGAFVRR